MEQITREADLNLARKRTKALVELDDQVRHVRQVAEPARLAQMQRDFEDAGLSKGDWLAFGMVFSGSPEDLISEALKQSQENEHLIEFGPAVAEANETAQLRPLDNIRKEREALLKMVGIDESKQRQYDQLKGSIDKLRRRCVVLDTELKRGADARGNLSQLKTERRNRYRDVFETFDEEKKKLERLYSPLVSKLTAATGALSKLGFFVERHVALDSWVEQGTKLIDRRSAGSLSGVDGLLDAVRRELLPVWQTGDADSVAAAMEGFISRYSQDLLMGRRRNQDQRQDKEDQREWLKRLGEWLFSTEHLNLVYGISYEGTPVEQLSPGTRGIVLLLLYLALDEKDRRPLLVDQPEENLDPRSVFRDLVEHFREARLRRQVIIVTHNPNLVVNADADQVLVATSTRDGSGLPTIRYQGGALEDLPTRAAVCNILEGGERAFRERERRYRLTREQPRVGHQGQVQGSGSGPL